MTIEQVSSQELIEKFGEDSNDSGNTEVQVAIMSHRIKYLTEHFKVHPKDHHGRRGLLRLVGRRSKLLKYLASRNVVRYRELIAELGLRR